jgi:hypothetical protein
MWRHGWVQGANGLMGSRSIFKQLMWCVCARDSPAQAAAACAAHYYVNMLLHGKACGCKAAGGRMAMASRLLWSDRNRAAKPYMDQNS